jgi:RNA polymerase-binding transcription factor DksA
VEDNADEVAMDDVNAGVRVRIEADLSKITKALARIQDGSYGIDEEGKQISEERLKVLPWADKAI